MSIVTRNFDEKEFNDEYENSMVGFLGIRFDPSSDTDKEVHATMPVNERTQQPYKVLCGGASIALGEILAGYGSWRLLGDDEMPVGASVTANHVSSVKAPSMVYATATILHRGKRTHLWNVDIKSEEGRLVCTVRVLNAIIPKPSSKSA